MRQDNINYLLVGIFVIVVMTGLVMTLTKLAGGASYDKYFYARYTSVTGVKKGTAVTYGGYQIGEVQEIKQEGRNFRLTLGVKKGWDIPQGSIARIVSPGLLSDNQINIEPSDKKIQLKDGEYLAGRDMVNIMNVLNDVAAEIKELSDTSLKPLFASLRKQIDAIGKDLAKRIPQITASTHELLEKLKKGADGVNKIVGQDNRQHIATTLKNFSAMSANLKKTSENLQAIRTKLTALLNNANGLVVENRKDVRRSVLAMRNTMERLQGNISVIMHNLEVTSRNLNEFSRQIRSNPGLLLGGKSPADKGAAR